MSNQILLPLETFAHKQSNNMASQYSDNCSKDELRNVPLSMDKDTFHSQDQSNSSSSGLGSGSESGTSDYQRSTPSPRDDPFQDQSLGFKEKSKTSNAKDDLGFVDDLNADDNISSVQLKSKSPNKSITPKKPKTKIGFSPRSFYKTSASHGDKINKLISDANNSFSMKRNRSKRDLNLKLIENESKCKKYKKRSSDSHSNKNKLLVSNNVSTSEKNESVSQKVTEKISNNASKYSFSGNKIKGCDPLRRDNVSKTPPTRLIVPNGVQNNVNARSHSAKINDPAKQLRENEIESDLKKTSKRRASEADLQEVRQNNKHPKIRTHKRSKSSSSRRRNDMKHILTNYQNRLIQQRHQDHQVNSQTASPSKNSLCNIIKPAKLTNVTPTKMPPSPSNVPIQVQQTIVKSNRQLIMLPPNMNRLNAIPTQINTTYNKQMIIVPAPNNMGSQLPAFYHHQSEVRTTSFTSIVPAVRTEASKPESIGAKHNPFLPATDAKSSFLFGNNDDFETAENGDDEEFEDEVILAMGSESSSEESEDEADDHIIYSPIDDDEGISFEEEQDIPKLSANSKPSYDNNAHLNKQSSNNFLHDNNKRATKQTSSFKETKAAKEKDHNFDEKLPTSDEQIKDIKDAYFSSNSNDSLASQNQDRKTCDNKIATKDSSQKIRFPAIQGPNNMIECKWSNCQMSFTTYGRLSDHLKAVHVTGQVSECNEKLKDNEEAYYKCMWSDCKVYNMASSSMSWLEKHVPTHGGKFSYPCIVSGCKMRFSSQKILQRHVNQHFATQEEKNGTKKNSENNSNGNISTKKVPSAKASKKSSSKYLDSIGPYGVKALIETQHGDVYLARKSVVNPAAMKYSSSARNLKQIGIKLKYRESMFSARNFDFFDAGVMAGVKDAVNKLENRSKDIFNINFNNVITFEVSEILATRNNGPNKRKTALVRWRPENLLDDEWVEISNRKHKPIRKRMKLCNLPEEAKSKIKEKLFGVTPPSQQIVSRKNENVKTHEKLGDISWIKNEESEDESKFLINNSTEKTVCQDIKTRNRKQSRKYNSSHVPGREYRSPLYSSSYLKPPIGLF